MTEKTDETPKKAGALKTIFATLFVLTAAAGSGGCQAPMGSGIPPSGI